MVCLLGRFPALAGIDLDVEAGEIVLVTGPNGAGKTTLVRLLAGLTAPHSGEAEVFGHSLFDDRRAARARTALVGHETYCYDDLTAAENVRFFARAAGIRDDDAVRDALDRVALGPAADVVHRGLSAGQRRRLALAVALVRDPELLLLDEPHAGLDATGREVVAAAVRAAPAEGRTVVMVSHEVEVARPLATREVRVDGGRVVASAPTGADEGLRPPRLRQANP
ncbi:MAG: heme ABC exporter ATP-binding protein CcmA [Acidimicrobiia bacterium]